MRLPRFRFSLFGLLAAIAVFGAALACILKFGLSLPLVTTLWSLLLLALMVGPILAILGRLEWRAFHGGFAWFGWMYVLVLMWGYAPDTSGTFPSSAGSMSPLRFPQMYIERAIYVVYQWIVPAYSQVMSSQDPESEYQNLAGQYDSRIWNPPVPLPQPTPPSPMTGGGGISGPSFIPIGSGSAPAPTVPSPPSLPFRYVPWESFRDVAHALLALLWATFGGSLAWFVVQRDSQRRQDAATPAP